MKGPVIVGALGGSGTRVIARIIRRAGYFLGTNLNESEDAMEFVEFYDGWINRYILRRIVPLIPEEDALMASEFAGCLARHRAECQAADAPWGWKEPRSIYLLSFFDQIIPEVKFIHVVRDGRDMAFSSNQNQLRKHGAAVLLNAGLNGAPQSVRTAALWSQINLEAAAYGEEQMPGRYFRVRFETLCAQPEETIRAIFDFLGAPDLGICDAVAEVSPPPSIGRWQHVRNEAPLAAIYQLAGQALRQFGYT